jgi:hypothetical protein
VAAAEGVALTIAVVASHKAAIANPYVAIHNCRPR